MFRTYALHSRPFLGCLIFLILTLSALSGSEEDIIAPLLKDDIVEVAIDGDTSTDVPGSGAVTIGEHYVVLEVFPHDHKAFTQGLTYFEGNLWEGTGMYDRSELRRVEPSTGKVLQTHKLHEKYFGEGIAHFTDKDGNGRIIQITWKRQTGWIYDAITFDIIKEFKYMTKTTEGWGITYNENEMEFIVSDGSSLLFFWDRDTLEEKRRVEVSVKVASETDPYALTSHSMDMLNELEWHNGSILANVWYQDLLLRIDPMTGNVSRVYDFSNLYKNRAQSADCFNGISVTDKEDEIWVTGKQWPHMYRIKLLA